MVYSALTPVASDFPQRSQNEMYNALSWAQQGFQNNQAFINPVTQDMANTATRLTGWGDADRARWEQVYQPLQNQIISDAQNWDSPDRRMQARGMATSRVGQAMDQADAAAARDLERYGVDPTSTRFAGVNRQAKLSRATAQAAASDTADRALVQEGFGARLAANQMGAQLPGQATTEAATGANIGAAAGNLRNATAQTFMPALGNPIGWGGLTVAGNNAYTGATSAINNAQLEQQKLSENSSSGLGSILGLVGGTIGSFAAPGIGTAIGSGLGRLAGGLADGGSGLTFEKGGEVPPRATDGYIDPSMSPSGGEETDDVSATGSGGSLRVDAGEFVIPQRTVQYYGTKYLEGLIHKADDAMGIAPQDVGPEMSEPVQAAAGGAIPGVPHMSPVMPRQTGMRRMAMHVKMPRTMGGSSRIKGASRGAAL